MTKGDDLVRGAREGGRLQRVDFDEYPPFGAR
jgi:hypothetical protein